MSGTIARYESLVLEAKIQQQNTPISVQQIEKRKELDKRSKKMEEDGFIEIWPEFPTDLQLMWDMMSEEEATGAKVNQVMKAAPTFQADAIIAHRYYHGQSHLIVANDTDFGALVGPSCLQLSEFNLITNPKDKENLSSMKIDSMTSIDYS